MAINSTC